MASEQIVTALRVIKTLESLNAPYFIGGSLASAVHGVARATLDADLVVQLQTSHARPLVQALQDTFYIDLVAVQQAIQQQSSFNLIHLSSMFKVDIFVSQQRPFDIMCFRRRVAQVVAHNPTQTAYISSAEDIVLAKLEWYRLGGEISERQWRDVLGILKINYETLDLAYMRQWSQNLDVAELLQKAMFEAKN